MSTQNVPGPVPAITPENAFFWTAGEHGELRFLHCQACNHVLHPPAPLCPQCLSDDLVVKTVSGRAEVATFTVNHHPWHPAFAPPYVLAIVEIEEAPYVRFTTRLVNCDPDDVRIGMPVRVRFEQAGQAWLPLFEPEVA
jgi:uncharacterized OB-fold protein